jgi:hypothetical protein
MNRLVAVLALGYVALALVYRAKEAGGIPTCDCHPIAGVESPA